MGASLHQELEAAAARALNLDQEIDRLRSRNTELERALELFLERFMLTDQAYQAVVKENKRLRPLLIRLIKASDRHLNALPAIEEARAELRISEEQ